jgi:uncharacterized membrane protein
MFEDIIPIATLMAIKASRPIIRKSLLKKIDEEQYLLINTISILFFIIIYCYIKQHLFDKVNPIYELPKTYNNLLLYDKIIISILSIMAIFATLSNFKIEASENSSSNVILTKIFGTMCIVATSYYTNKEPLTMQMILGYIIIFCGLILLGNDVKT